VAMSNDQILNINQETFQDYYAEASRTIEYPNELMIRFYHNYLKHNIESGGRVLDFGFGSGNNSVYLIEQGYNVYGLEVVSSTIRLVEDKLKRKNLPGKCLDNFKEISARWEPLPFEDSFFEFILSNLVLYYYATEDVIQRTCKELARCLRPGGIVLFTMIGTKNSIISNAKQIDDLNTYEVPGKGKRASLDGQLLYFVHDEDQLKNLFSGFKPMDIGYYDENIFGRRDFIWVFVGQKPGD
jgi:SAM-dependent methyltransferase